MVSAVRPGYVVTDDRERHDVGDTLRDGWRLAAVTMDIVAVERGGRRHELDLDPP